MATADKSMAAGTDKRISNILYPPSVASASGIVALLTDVDVEVKECALQALLKCVDCYWHEISESLADIEVLAQDMSFPHRKIASLLAAKLTYHLDLMDETLQHAMGAEDLLDTHDGSEFTLTVIAKAVQRYCTDRQRIFDFAASEDTEEEPLLAASSLARSASTSAPAELLSRVAIDFRLEALVERMFEESLSKGGLVGFKEAIGVALDARRLDKVKEAIDRSSDKAYFLKYCVQRSAFLTSKRFRSLLHNFLVEIYEREFPTSNVNALRMEYGGIAHAFFLAGQLNKVAELLDHLLFTSEDSEGSTLRAYQCAFDLVSYENRPFVMELLSHPLLQLPQESPIVEAAGSVEHLVPSVEPGQASSPLKDTDRLCSSADDEHVPLLQQAQSSSANTEDLPGQAVAPKQLHVREKSPAYLKIERIRRILSGVATLELTVKFLHRMNHTDLTLLDKIKASVDGRSSITQNAIVICHGLMQAGTTCDAFLRENLDWLGKAVCWAKFTAAGSISLLHKGHTSVSRQVLSSYLPGSGGGPYSEGGALFGLGIIHANLFDADLKPYLIDQLKNAQTYCPQNYEPLQHGACLGLGLLSMQTGDSEVYAALRDVVFMDSAVAGEAAAMAIGFVSLGSGNEDIFAELLGHAQETEHERVVRGAALGAAFILYRKEEIADGLLDQMEPMIRYGGMFATGLAYCGTSNAAAVRRLLHAGVADMSDDVRRAAVISLGFVLCNSPHQVPAIVSLLTDSFNPHVRYAAALAVGIACCGTGSLAAVDLLLPMTQDTTDFVRQAALLGLGLTLVQVSIAALPDNRVRQVRDLMVRVAADKHEDPITRFGAIVAQGLVDAGGRNSTISFFSNTGAIRPEAAVGLVLFSQLWFWHPLIVSVALAFRPTALMGLAEDLSSPEDFEVISLATISKFAYIEPVTRTKKEEKRGTVTAVLSAAYRRKQQEHIKKLNTQNSSAAAAMPDTEMKKSGSTTKLDVEMDTADVKMVPSVNEEPDKGEATEEKTAPQNSLLPVVLQNPCRVVSGQEAFISFECPSSNWIPIDPSRRSGIVLLKRKEGSPSASGDIEMKEEAISNNQQ